MKWTHDKASVIGEDGKWVAECNTYANAKLIAAAPEMLEGLQELLEDHKNGIGWLDFEERITALIEKATK